MSATTAVFTSMRAFGTVIVFSIVGPVAIALGSVAAVAVLGSPFVELFTALTGLHFSSNWMFITLILWLGFMSAASALPSLLTGIVFAIFAFGFGHAGLGMAWLAAAIVMIGFAYAGVVVAPAESSPLILVPVGSFLQAMYLALFLSVPAVLASSVAWLFSRPFHRVRLSA